MKFKGRSRTRPGDVMRHDTDGLHIQNNYVNLRYRLGGQLCPLYTASEIRDSQ